MSVLQNLPASVGEFFPGSRVFHLVDVVQQWFQPAELANQCRGGFAAQSDPGDVIHRIARQREHIADKFWRDLPFCGDLAFAQQRECILGRRDVRFRCRIDFYARADQLIKILVVGREHNLHPGPLTRGDGVTAHEVIGLSVRERNISKAQQRCEFLDKLELRDHRLGHLFARLLVSGLQFHSLLRHALVPYDCAQVRLQMFQH